jgi:hypothetical protein
MAEAALAPSGSFSASPTVRVEGQELALVSASVVAMVMTESEGGLCSLELRLSNFGSTDQGARTLFEEERDLKLGSNLSIYAGEVNAPREIFRGRVSGLEADFPYGEPPELVVLAEDQLQLARFARRSKVHDKLTIKSLAESLAAQLSLTPRVTGLGEDLGTQVQLNESDLAFLRRLLERVGADLQVVGDELHVSPRADVDRGEVELHVDGQLRGVRFVADLADQVTQVSCTGWDDAQGQPVKAISSGAHLGPGSGRTGAQLLSQLFHERAEHIGHLAVTTAAEATALADAAFDRRARRFVTATGTCEGNPRVRVGSRVKLVGTSDRFDNTYYVVRAVHRFDMISGYKTDFEAESAFLGTP